MRVIYSRRRRVTELSAGGGRVNARLTSDQEPPRIFSLPIGIEIRRENGLRFDPIGARKNADKI